MRLRAALVACSKAYIPNTDVEDTSENRKVIQFCEQYRHAVEDKNVGQLLKMASAAYHKRGAGNDDDIDYAGLKDFLTTTFQSTDAISYEIRYRRVTFAENTHVYVDYTYAASFRIPGIEKEEWRHSVADNRLDLMPDGFAQEHSDLVISTIRCQACHRTRCRAACPHNTGIITVYIEQPAKGIKKFVGHRICMH